MDIWIGRERERESYGEMYRETERELCRDGGREMKSERERTKRDVERSEKM